MLYLHYIYMKLNEYIRIKDIFFIVALVVVTYLTLRLFQPYLNILFISLVIVQIFQPVYRLIYRSFKSEALATFISIISALILTILPLSLIFILSVSEISTFTANRDILGSVTNLQLSINETITNINGFLETLNPNLKLSSLDLETIILNLALGAKEQILPVTQQILTLSGEILFNLFLLLISLIFFFPLYKNMPELFTKISPLDKRIDLLLFDKFRATTKGVLKGTFFVAIVQASAVLIPLLLLNVSAPVLLWVIMVILSVLPIGSGLVWGPIGIGMFIGGLSTGNTTQIILAIALLIYSAVIINVIDTTLRPRIVKNTINIHPLVTIFSVLGGLSVFGPIGILYGPIIVVFFLSMLEVYNKQYLKE